MRSCRLLAVLRRSPTPLVVALPKGTFARSLLCLRSPPSVAVHLQRRLGCLGFHASSALSDHYSALGISKSASPSAKDIKIAYFKIARTCHPDSVRSLSAKEQAAAKKKFQEAANAYEVLSNPTKKTEYDKRAPSSQSGFWGQSSSDQQQQQQQQANANQTWSNVSNDADVIEEAIHEYAAELKENAELAAEGIARGDFDPAWAFLKNHKGLVASVVLPTLLIFRFPGPVMVALRFVPQALLGLLAMSVRIGGTSGLMSLWRLVGTAATFGSQNAAGVAKSYVEDRRRMREQARARSQRDAEQRASSSGHKGNTGRRSRHTKK